MISERLTTRDRFWVFCEKHIEMFSKRISEKVSREKLIEAILKPRKPHPWRTVWLDLLRDAIIDTCEVLAKTVHKVSPDTYLGLMSSGPAIHCTEGVIGKNSRRFSATASRYIAARRCGIITKVH